MTASASSNPGPGPDPATAYFATNPPPPALHSHTTLARAFISDHLSHSPSRRLVLVTSGGTTVPLENQTVRFIDNFSAGTRGATSAEYFLREGYAVIFLHRQFSLLPFSRHYSHSTDCFLDFMDDVPDPFGADDDHGGGVEGGEVVVKQQYQRKMLRVLREYQAAKRKNMLLVLPFTTVTEYLFLLRALAMEMRPLGPRALFYLAAAVSDFFIPRDRLVEHKIQSGEEPPAALAATAGTNGSAVNSHRLEAPAAGVAEHTSSSSSSSGSHKQLLINLDPVPKFLRNLVSTWKPSGSMVVSFKLETDPKLLIGKSRQALRRYGHDLVIGNLLTTRKWEVVFVMKDRDGGGEGEGNKGNRGGDREREPERWIRVPRLHRGRSVSGKADMVGMAEKAKEDNNKNYDANATAMDDEDEEEQPDLNGGEVRDGMEIESLIVPALAGMHGDAIRAAAEAATGEPVPVKHSRP